MNTARRVIIEPRCAASSGTQVRPPLFRRADSVSPSVPPGFLLRNARQYGDLVYLPLARQHAYRVNRPEWIRDILVTHQSNFVKSRMLERAKVLLGEGLLTSEGEFHTRQRRLVQPAFHRDRMAHYGHEMVACAARVRDCWQAGAVFDVAAEMQRLTLAIVGRTLFSADVSSQAGESAAR